MENAEIVTGIVPVLPNVSVKVIVVVPAAAAKIVNVTCPAVGPFGAAVALAIGSPGPVTLADTLAIDEFALDAVTVLPGCVVIVTVALLPRPIVAADGVGTGDGNVSFVVTAIDPVCPIESVKVTVAVPGLSVAVSVKVTEPVDPLPGTGVEAGDTVTIVVSELFAVSVCPGLLVTEIVCEVPLGIVIAVGETIGAGGGGVPICCPSYATM